MIKKTELYIENRQVDLYGDEAFLLNFNVADISDISAKASSYSKELDIPATKDNNQTFTHLFNVSSEGQFNPLSKKTAEVYVDGVCVMRGFFKLNHISIIDAEYVTYHGVIYEDSVNFVQALGDLELSNLVLPLTGNTGQVTGTTQPITFSGFTSTEFVYNPGLINGVLQVVQAQSRKYNLRFSAFSNPSNVFGAYGSLVTIPKPTTAPWQLGLSAGIQPGGNIFSTLAPRPGHVSGGNNSNHSVGSITTFVAAQDCVLTLTPQIWLTNVRTVKHGFIRTKLVNGIWEHTPVSQLSTTTVGPPVFLGPTVTIQLDAGEGLYYYFADANGVPYTGPAFSTVPPPAIGINPTLTKITGTIQLNLLTSTNNLLIDEYYIMNNISLATNSSTSDICFPLVDYNQTFPFSTTNQSTTQVDESEKLAVKVRFEDLRPAVFVKRVWDEIFKQNGFKYKSKFLDTNADLFKKLIVIGGMEEDEVESLQYHRVLTGTTSGQTTYLLTEPLQDIDTQASPIIFKYRTFLLGGNKGSNGLPITGATWQNIITRSSYTENLLETYTDANRNNAAHGFSGAQYGNVLRALVSGKYKIQAQIDATSQSVQFFTSDANLQNQGLIYRLVMEKLEGGSFTSDPSLFTAHQKSAWKAIKTVSFQRSQALGNQDFLLSFDETIGLEKGDLVRVVLYASAEAQNDPGGTNPVAFTSKTLLKTNGSCFIKYYRLGSWMGYTATSLTNMLPTGMKQSEFIMSIAKMFNLYFEPDKQDPRTIYIEPRDTYYEDGRVLNWEKKLDYSKPIDISILPHDQSKNFIFKYEDDSSDYYTEQFKKFNANNLTFGSYDFQSPDEYVTDSTEVVPDFAASYLQKISGTDPNPIYSGSDAVPMVITKIIDPDSQKPGYTGKGSPWKKEPRILIYGGKIQLPPVQFRNYRFYLTGTQIDGDGIDIEMLWYPYAGHYDKPVQPTVDINFFTDTSYLPTTYWKNNFGNAYPANPTTSTTSVTLSATSVGTNVSLTYTGANYFAGNTFVDKYVRVTSQTTPTTYFVGLIVSATSSTITLRITEAYGTGTFTSWKLQLVDVLMKYNLFNTFYKQQMIELTDQTARLMTCNMYLTPVDIANFRFNDIVYAHDEYWRVNKIIDFDTSSDVNQTTKIELIKIVRAQTSRLIDYIQGGYLGIAGGTGGGTTTTGTGTLGGTTPSVVQLGPAGTQSQYTNGTFDQLGLVRNSIIRNVDGVTPTFFDAEVTIFTGTETINATATRIGNDLNLLRETAEVKPIGESITYTDEDAGNITIDGRYSQVYFDVRARNILFIMTLQDVAAVDGFTVHFDALNATTTTFMQIENGNATTNEIFVINQDNSVVAKYDGTKELWIISRG